MVRGRILPRLFALLGLLLTALPAFAAEEIELFRSDVQVQANGDFLVKETIRVNAEGNQINHGIYRDFPLTFEDSSGRTVHAGFELISATRDGVPEETRVQRGSRQVRIYLGSADTLVPHGVHTYTLTYRSDRQVRFFEDHDEIYWNATGTEWVFPILKAEAMINLPPGAKALATVSYTGPYGSRENNAASSNSNDGNSVTFTTTKPLGPREGLSVDVRLAKGFIDAPDRGQTLRWFLRDNIGKVVAVGGTLLVFLYYLVTWWLVGRDPPKGVIVPRWDLSDGLSPALTHYIWNHGLKRQGFPALTAAAINLAVKGYIELNDIGDTITLKHTGKTTAGVTLPVGEAALLRKIDGYGGSITVSKANGSKVSSLGTAFRSTIEGEHRKVFYRHNRGWVALGMALSVATLLGTLLLGDLSNDALGILLPGLMIGTVFTIFAVNFAKSYGGGLTGKIQLAIFGFISVVFLLNSGIVAASILFTSLDNPAVFGGLVSLALVNLLFFFLMGAPTQVGRSKLDEIAGLRRYLSVSEEDRMNMAGAPQMSPQHFETLLPYAVALNVEKPWSQAFATWLTTAVATGAVAAGYYAPRWYHGRNLADNNIGDRIGDLAGSMSDSFTASLPTPKSSSSGFSSGGGFSGGGGGGGGGGGW